MVACVLVVVPQQCHANPTAGTEEINFLDLVDGEGNVLIQAQGVDAVNAGRPGPKPGLSCPGVLVC